MSVKDLVEGVEKYLYLNGDLAVGEILSSRVSNSLFSKGGTVPPLRVGLGQEGTPAFYKCP